MPGVVAFVLSCLFGWGDPELAFGSAGEGVNPSGAVAGGRSQVGADGADGLGAVQERMQAETLMRSLLILTTCPASLLLNGTRRSWANRR